MDMKKRTQKTASSLRVVFDREEDGRWIAEVPKLPGVLSYGKTKQEAQRRVSAIALRTLADTVEQGGTLTRISSLFDYEMAGR
jgi:predicted RNase H-like HicB family nuclease